MLYSKALSANLLLVLIACSNGTEPPNDMPTPPGTEIVFQAGEGDSAAVYVVNADGSGLTRLSDAEHADFAPSWSGDGREIYFISSNRDGHTSSGLYAMNPDGTNVHLIVDGVAPPYDVSPDGTRIAFGALGPQGDRDLLVGKADGSEQAVILDIPCDYTLVQCMEIDAAAWSPDGQQIAYSVYWRGHGNSVPGLIGTVNADGTGQKYITTSELRSTHPAWAPDGQRIAFSSVTASTIPTPGAMALEIMNADGTGRTALMIGGSSPTWSPDGQSIGFAEAGGLFAVNADGTGLRQITDEPGGAAVPDWNPAGP